MGILTEDDELPEVFGMLVPADNAILSETGGADAPAPLEGRALEVVALDAAELAGARLARVGLAVISAAVAFVAASRSKGTSSLLAC